MQRGLFTSKTTNENNEFLAICCDFPMVYLTAHQNSSGCVLLDRDMGSTTFLVIRVFIHVTISTCTGCGTYVLYVIQRYLVFLQQCDSNPVTPLPLPFMSNACKNMVDDINKNILDFVSERQICEALDRC